VSDLQTQEDWIEIFLKFIKFLKIDSKELESDDPTGGSEFKLWTSQKLFLKELAYGLSKGIRVFYVLKSRQLGISTVSLAIDIFWLALFPGTIGSFVVDTEANRETFRAVIRRYIKSFPPNFFGKSFNIVKGGDNRNMMRFSNGSRLDFLVAGTRKNSVWAESKGYVLSHLSEVSKYGDARGLDSFKESMSQTHPNRLYIYESTASGYNHWYSMWTEAARDTDTIHRMFIGWWANDLNMIKENDPRFIKYGIDAPNEDERAQIDWVKTHCGLTIKMKQLAWYRWRCSDTSVDMDSIHQLQPWNDEECFVKSGNSFFPVRVIGDLLKQLEENPVEFYGFRYWLGNDFYTGRMEEIVDQERVGEVDLRIWEKPREGHRYAIGVDAALGRTDNADQNTIEVFDCYADQMVQVAEYASDQDDTRQAAWVLAYLAGIYTDCRINVDVTGGYGTAIMNELDQLKQRMRSEMYSKLTGSYQWDDFLSNASWYLYHRPDSMGAGYAKNWVWGSRTKFWAINSYRDSFCSNLLCIRSKRLLNQMAMVVRDGSDIGAFVGAKGRQHDDLVFAAILAEVAWKEWLRPVMINESYTYESVNMPQNTSAGQNMTKFVESITQKFFKEQAEASEQFDDRPQYLVDRGLA
jgi:hypothetical protein